MMRKSLAAVVLILIAFTWNAHAVEFEADMVMLPQNMSGKVYIKSNRVNRQEMMGTTTILKNGTVYQLFEQTKKYVTTDTKELEKSDPMAGIADFKTWANRNGLKKTGKESVQGYACHIYEGQVKGGDNAPPTRVKIWLSTKLDYPVKSEMFLAPPTGKVTSMLKNIKRQKQPDSLFSVPKGYTKAADMAEAMGMQGLGSLFQGNTGDQGTDGGQMSPEQMGEMAEKLQQMLQQMQQ